MSVETTIREKLTEAFAPTRLDVINESHLHAGHRNSPGTGESHFRVLIVSSAFAGASRVARHRAVNKLLEANGLTEKDVRFLNMDNATSRAALVTKDIEAAFGGNDLLSLRDQGAVKIVYTSRGDPRFLRHCSWIGT